MAISPDKMTVKIGKLTSSKNFHENLAIFDVFSKQCMSKVQYNFEISPKIAKMYEKYGENTISRDLAISRDFTVSISHLARFQKREIWSTVYLIYQLAQRCRKISLIVILESDASFLVHNSPPRRGRKIRKKSLQFARH